MFGVAVGKVTQIDLVGTTARVGLAVQRDRPLYRNTTLAIRYQNLTGQRYVDTVQPERRGELRAPGSTFSVAQTVPSFDITALFNGMRPVLNELSPEAINKFMQNALAVIQGDGRAVGATLSAIAELSRYVSDRDAMLSTLVRNISAVDRQIGGRSAPVRTLIKGISEVFVNLQKQFVGLMHFVSVAPPVLGPLNQLLAALGFTYPENPDLQSVLNLISPEPKVLIDLFGLLPGLLQPLVNAVPARGQPRTVATCSKGRAPVPDALGILIAGQQVTICRR